MFLFELIEKCSPNVNLETMSALIQTESSVNPFSIAIVNGKSLKNQPKSKEEAEQIIEYLEKKGINYSVGIAQINKVNFSRFHVDGKQLLDPCLNLKVSQIILQECFYKYKNVNDSLSCYYSGNNKTGYQIENIGSSYVARVHKNLVKVSNKEIYDIKIPSLKNNIYVDKEPIKANNHKKLVIFSKNVKSLNKKKSIFYIKSNSKIVSSTNK